MEAKEVNSYTTEICGSRVIQLDGFARQAADNSIEYLEFMLSVGHAPEVDLANFGITEKEWLDGIRRAIAYKLWVANGKKLLPE